MFSQDCNVLPFKNPNDHIFQTLEDLITNQQAFKVPPYSESEDPKLKFNRPDKRALAANLVLHLSVFCPWRHTSLPWDGNFVHFVDLSPDDGNRAVPYISWNVRHDSSIEYKSHQTIDDNTMIRSFTSLAKLLLEIEFGRMPGHDTLTEDNLRERVQKYHNQWKEYGHILVAENRYFEAIDACLGFHRAYNQERLLGLGRTEKPEETYRRLIRTKIAPKIITDLPEFEPPQEKRARSTPFQFDSDDLFFESIRYTDNSFHNAESSTLLDPSTPLPTSFKGIEKPSTYASRPSWWYNTLIDKRSLFRCNQPPWSHSRTDCAASHFKSGRFC
jgi:hypothetical protein